MHRSRCIYVEVMGGQGVRLPRPKCGGDVRGYLWLILTKRRYLCVPVLKNYINPKTGRPTRQILRAGCLFCSGSCPLKCVTAWEHLSSSTVSFIVVADLFAAKMQVYR